MVDMRIHLIHEFVELTQRKRALEAKLKEVNHELGETEKQALEFLTDNGLKSVKVDDGTVTHTMRVRARINPATAEEAHKRMREIGLGDMVKPTVNAQTLSAWIRENDNEIPDQLRDHILVYEDHKLGFRRAS